MLTPFASIQVFTSTMFVKISDKEHHLMDKVRDVKELCQLDKSEER